MGILEWSRKVSKTFGHKFLNGLFISTTPQNKKVFIASGCHCTNSVYHSNISKFYYSATIVTYIQVTFPSKSVLLVGDNPPWLGHHPQG